VLYEPSRSEPLMPRMRSVITPASRMEVGGQSDVVRQRRLATRERVVPVDTERPSVNRRLELEPVARPAYGRRSARLRGPFSSTDSVCPLMVMSPLSTTSSPLRSIDLETKESSG